VVNGNVHVEYFITTRRGRGARARKQKRWKREREQPGGEECVQSSGGATLYGSGESFFSLS